MTPHRTSTRWHRRAIPALVATLALATTTALAATAAPVVVPHWTPTADAPALPAEGIAWSFAAPRQTGASAWTAERGRVTPEAGGAQLRPDTSRRVIVVSPDGLPESLRGAESFVIGVPADAGLQRVRVQGRRDARGGWITLADGKGDALRSTPNGIAVTRAAGSRASPIDALRIELTFRTTNPRTLTAITALPTPR